MKLTDNQKQAIISTDTHVLVSAGAGCGKTMVLVERYLEVFRKFPDADVNEIIAVTFTRKAAEEMRSRLKARLISLLNEAGPDQERWSHLLENVDRARIGTIHSLCESILKAHPAEAGVDPQFEVLDDLERAALMDKSIEEALLLQLDSAAATDALFLEYPIETIKGWVLRQLESLPQFQAACANYAHQDLRTNAIALINRVRKDTIGLLFASKQLEHCASAIEAMPWHDAKSPLEEKRQQTLAALHRVITAGESGDFDAAHSALVDLAALPSANTLGGPKGKPLRDVLSKARKLAKAFCEDSAPDLCEHDDRAFELLQSLLSLINTALTNYQTAKRTVGKLDYNDLILQSYQLVKDPASPVRKHISANIRTLLIDEFQDTNRLQAQLLSCLCSDEGRLFLIGDDKQSIYKFQGADVATFNEWKAKLHHQTHGMPGEGVCLKLSDSFRSHPSIVGFINKFFAQQFLPDLDEQFPHKACHQPLVAARQDESQPERVEVILSDSFDPESEKRNAEKSRRLEARSLSCFILDKITCGAQIFDKEINEQRPIEFGDIAVLAQTNDDFIFVQQALSAAEIPFVTYAGSGLLKRQEVADVENMLRWLSNPSDDHALLSVLRSPFFGFNDGLLHRLVMQRHATLWEGLEASAKDPELSLLKRPFALLKQLLEDSHAMRLSELVRSMIALTAYDVTVLAMPNGRQMSRNVWKLASLITNYDDLSITSFVKALESMREHGLNKETDAPLSAENAVKLMTIHKSKGLEFPVVLLPLLGRRVHQLAPKLLVHGEFGLALDTTRGPEETKPSHYQAASWLNGHMETEEKKRLLYVAMTRSRDYLALFIDQGSSNHESFATWIKQSLSIGDSDTTKVSALKDGTHFTSRYVDDDSICQWETATSSKRLELFGAAGKNESFNNVEFDLVAPLVQIASSQPGSNKTAGLRVTAPAGHKAHPSILGNLFHAAMQRLACGSLSLSEATLKVLVQSDEIGVCDRELQQQLLNDCQVLLEKFQQSRLKEMLATARMIMPEVDYTMIVGESNTDSAYSGRPDLVFQDQDGAWHIVDFKTDHIVPDQIDAKVNEHSAQVLRYVRDFESIVKLKAKGWLYFAQLSDMAAVEDAGFAVSQSGQLNFMVQLAPGTMSST